MEPFVVQGVDLLGGEVDVDHRRRPSGTSWSTESGDELTIRVTQGQPSTFSREGRFWIIPPGENAWERREPFQPGEDAELEPVPGHYLSMIGLPI